MFTHSVPLGNDLSRDQLDEDEEILLVAFENAALA